MTDEEICEYATYLIKGQAVERDYLAIFEVFEEWGPQHDLGDMLEEDDAQKISNLMRRAVVTVTFPDAS